MANEKTNIKMAPNDEMRVINIKTRAEKTIDVGSAVIKNPGWPIKTTR